MAISAGNQLPGTVTTIHRRHCRRRVVVVDNTIVWVITDVAAPPDPTPPTERPCSLRFAVVPRVTSRYETERWRTIDALGGKNRGSGDTKEVCEASCNPGSKRSR